MIAMRVMKTAINEVIDVIAMRHGFVAAARTVAMPVGMQIMGAANGILSIDLNAVLAGFSVCDVN
jgi:hypothetical protein